MQKIILADDHSLIRSGLRRVLEQHNFDVIAEAEDSQQAYLLFEQLSPQLLIMDISMPGMSGLEAIRRIKAKDQDAKIIIFSMYESTSFIAQALTTGAMSYVAKSEEMDVMLHAIDNVLNNKTYLSPNLTKKMAYHEQAHHHPLKQLSSREFEIFRLLAEGKLTENIANALKISPKTAANYQTSLKQKLGIATPVELVRLAIRYGLIDS